MKGFGGFLLGLVVGGAIVFGSLKYHIVRAEDGFHTVPKLSSQFSQTYVDIRRFDLADWDEHRTLAIALVRADKGHLLKDSASSSLRRSVDGVLEMLGEEE